MASKNLKRCIPVLETLSTVKDAKKRKMLLRMFEDNLRRAIREISHNLLQGNITLNEEDKKRLTRFKKILRLLADPKTKKLRFRRIVSQTGRGFLPLLIPLIVSAVTAMI